VKRLVFIVLALVPATAFAHKPSDSYLTLRPGSTVEARWDIAVRDLDHALALDDDGDGAITWGEIRTREAALGAYAIRHLSLSGDGQTCAPTVHPLATVEHSDGAYLVLPLSFACAAARSLTVDYRLCFDRDPQHRGIVRLDDGSDRTVVLGPRDAVVVAAGD